ncbi:carbohydrate ABC transporter permease [Cellulomonas fimi]|uniref:Binding-protein-dependent transport systems inner membrane component n=1 Tax=Cellulomonas fimi (strain ATCC 484 / DSM 20113 / JCM 1341 / CCUG 24087 / LMG 16345 / NBRC 15513 / NCIMB 8980 / NCTC 7547 / NRS-133) TaxID=590998 RepID=F4H7C9_CELFA|nr:sugar ABC transporter permease [Cellulomonas fimi]AEE46890.1 binding-protein-dependent transport systems inner membrane component [Cellulomonas fimi ATCC 484]NNH08818.1 sugar ABC transporter permease [Cellulomonas fimi]VEH34477.1 sn-glycerol-3-phosphate transport system permease protein ugpA [Cellulomonas fimi]
MTTAPSGLTGPAVAAAHEPDAARPSRKVPGGVGRGSAWYRRLTPYLFLLVPVGLLLLLTYAPVVNMFWYSVTDWDGLDKTKNFVGLENYVDVFTDPDNVRVFLVSLYYVVGSFVQMALALYFATILSFKVRFKNMWKGILFFPYLINGVAIGLIFLNFLKPGGGLDTVLLNTGLESLVHQWTGDPEVANYALAAVSVWRYTGLTFVMFLGAIQSINSDIYEAASLDGANRWHEFWHIILPSIRPIVGLAFILGISGSLSVFEIPYVMTGGANGTETFVIRTVWMAFQRNTVGLASAMAVVLLVFVLVVTWLQRRIVPDEEVDLT